MTGRHRPHIVVTGLMGVGKTTTAAAVADSLGWPHRDSDVDVERREHRTGREIAAERGVPALHAIEAEVLLDALRSAQPAVISAAASVVDRADCRAALHKASVVVLELAVDAQQRRMATGGHRRPMDRSELLAVRRRRAVRFDEVADLTLDATRPTHELVQAVLDDLT